MSYKSVNPSVKLFRHLGTFKKACYLKSTNNKLNTKHKLNLLKCQSINCKLQIYK